MRLYDYISVREKFEQRFIKDMINKDVPVLIDPTLLVDKKEWQDIIPDRIVNEEYIFFYTLFATKEMIDIVKLISKKLGLKVIISNISNQYEIFSGFEKKTESGPLEFLSLIKYAKLVCVSSFHGTVFSIILNRPFFAINGMSDNRISTLLEMTKLTQRALTKNNVDECVNNMFNINFEEAAKNIKREKEKSILFLKEALDLDLKEAYERNLQ